MYLAHLKFNMPESVNEEMASDLIGNLLRCLRDNGQIYERTFPPVVVCGQQCITSIFLSSPDAMEAAPPHRLYEQSLSKLLDAGFGAPELTVFGLDADYSPPCSCDKHESYILFTNFLSFSSPLRCGECFQPIPLYKVPPIEPKGYFSDVLIWQSEYQACDTLNMLCGVLEKAGIREMSRFDSKLSKSGRAICDNITTSTGIPTYYYLFHDTARSMKIELARKCPECGGEWQLDKSIHIFDFKCDKCRLLSNVAWDIRPFSDVFLEK
jgi:predicted  nucleic acid-binding Zn ribbon protein